MTTKRFLTAVACSSLFLGLSGCPPTPSADDAQADFFVAAMGQGGQPGYTPQGWGWKPGSKVAISMWHEPTGPGSVLSEWKPLFEVTVDSNSQFGFESYPKFHPVNRTICGQPQQGQTAMFMAKADTGRIRMRQIQVDLYFTFRPCP